MRWEQETKAQFSVFLLCSDVERGAGIKAALFQEGFDVYLFTAEEILFSRVKDSPPHVLVLTHGSLMGPLDEFVQKVVDVSSEIRFLPVCPTSEMQNLVKYRPYNFFHIVVEGDALYERIVWSVDEICQSIYIRYQSEHVYSICEQANREKELAIRDKEIAGKKMEMIQEVAMTLELKKYEDCQTKEETLNLFFRELERKFAHWNKNLKLIYFQYLPSVFSLVTFQSFGVDVESLKGIGGRLTQEEFTDPVSFFINRGVPKELRDLMSEGLGVDKPFFYPIFVQNNLDGLFALWIPEGEISSEEVENDLALFKLIYERIFLIQKMNSLNLFDEITGFYDRQHYMRQLTGEVARAKRLQKAVTVLKFCIDQFSDFNHLAGRQVKNQILRFIASVIKKTSRVNDISCRTGENEFAVVLPHATKKGACVRAERLRRMIEVSSLKWVGVKVTISCGVSEYPAHCLSTDELEITSQQALEYVQKNGGNNICLYQPPSSFRPDYDVPPT